MIQVSAAPRNARTFLCAEPALKPSKLSECLEVHSALTDCQCRRTPLCPVSVALFRAVLLCLSPFRFARFRMCAQACLHQQRHGSTYKGGSIGRSQSAERLVLALLRGSFRFPGRPRREAVLCEQSA